MRKVQVLLSTYNAEKYIEELLNSVLNQDYPNFDILIRDDGSNDNTLNILKKYIVLNNVRIFPKKNIGVVRSFFRLLELSSPDAKYLAFCDQDDIWEKDKISQAIKLLENIPGSNKIPVMYFSRYTIVNEQLEIIGYSKIPKRSPSFKNALVENIATGCTICINNVARELILKDINFAITQMHDWWIYLVVSGFGKIIYDSVPKILYRQHSSNLVGIKTGYFEKWMCRISRFLKRGGLPLVTKQAEEFKRIYSSCLNNEKKEILNKFIEERKTLAGRIRYSVRGEVYRQALIDDIILRILIILNYI